jgi:cell division protein FtsI (penicillin-binding protein 3)
MPSSRFLYSSGRIVFIQILFVFGFLLLVARLIYLQLFQDVFLDGQVLSRSHLEYSLLAPRGRILDRENNILAFDVISYSVGIDFSKFNNNQESISALSEILNVEETSILSSIKKQNKGYREIIRNISPKTKLALEKGSIKGLYFRKNLRRSYPQKNTTAHVVGLTDIDRNGIQGTELVFNNELEGEEGKFEGIKGSGDTKIEGKRREAKPGKDVVLTIDTDFQSIAYHQLNKAIDRYKAHSGSVVIVQPKTGEILSLVSYPSFNPSNRKNITDMSIFRNRASVDVFEPGSVLKPIAMSAIIESQKEELDSVIETSPGWIEVSGYRTSDFKDYGKLSLSQIISLSSNVGMVKLCSNQDIEHLTNYYKKFGIGEYPISIILPAREGFLPHHSEFSLRDKVSSCYGYGMTLSALQIAQAYMVFANNGYFKELRLFKDKLFESNRESQVISQETNRLITEMLEETVNSDTGTARAARIKGKIVAGKTGTAMESLEEDTSYTATFSGYVPSNNPDYLTVVVLHGLKGEESSGGRVAAPVFSNIMHEIYLLNDLEI